MTKEEAKIELVELLCSQITDLITMAKSANIETTIDNDFINEIHEIKENLYDQPIDISDVLINGLYGSIIDLTTTLKIDLGEDVVVRVNQLREIIDDTTNEPINN